jgi:hypothetical protein
VTSCRKHLNANPTCSRQGAVDASFQREQFARPAFLIFTPPVWFCCAALASDGTIAREEMRGVCGISQVACSIRTMSASANVRESGANSTARMWRAPSGAESAQAPSPPHRRSRYGGEICGTAKHPITISSSCAACNERRYYLRSRPCALNCLVQNLRYCSEDL